MNYLAPAEPGELGFLFSFHYFHSEDLGEYLDRHGYTASLFVDSGAFSAFSQGVEVRLTDYVRFVRENSRRITRFANLDVIGNPTETRRNQTRMERMGLRPLPVVHFGTDPNEIKAYADHGYQFQCLGGMVPHLSGASQAMRGGTSHPLLTWLDRCHEVAKEHGVVLHGFGATNPWMVSRYPWATVDSSTWCSGFRFGRASLFDWRRKRMVPIQLRDRDLIMRYQREIREYGANPVSLIRDDRHSRVNLAWVTSRSFLAFQRYVRTRNPGFQRLYLATTNTKQDVKTAMRAVRRTTP